MPSIQEQVDQILLLNDEQKAQALAAMPLHERAEVLAQAMSRGINDEARANGKEPPAHLLKRLTT